jgi:hypothetical protein
MTATTESPEARLYAAGFTRQLEFWLAPDGYRVLNLGDAIAGLDSATVRGSRSPVPSSGTARLAQRRPDAELRRLARSPP